MSDERQGSPGHHVSTGQARETYALAGLYEDRPNSGAYQAWGMGHVKQGMLDLRTKDLRRGDLVPTHLFLGARYDGDVVTLAFPDRLVTLTGRNLERFREDFAKRQIGFVQEFTPDRWPEPPAHEPVILSISVVNPRPPTRV